MSEDRVYLTVGEDPHGRGKLAIITRGCVQHGDKNVTVLTLEVVKNMKAAKSWYRRMLVEQPWVMRQ